MNITIVGIGYVGLSLALLLSKDHNVIALDIDQNKVNSVNKKISPINDKEIIEYLKKPEISIKATLDKFEAYKKSDYIIISTPTNFDENNKSFDTSSIESVISDILKINKSAQIVIKSTIPIGFTKSIRENYGTKKIFYSPEFLREGRALYDNLYPSRIIVGDISTEAKEFAEILKGASLLDKDNIELLFMSSTEAESVKLFSNTYLAMRISFFNELDTFAEIKNISSENIIMGMSKDPRIGDYYNNPSFGYGGYCLPKDSQQLLSNFSGVPNEIISSIVSSNNTRKEFINKTILSKKPKTIGIYRLTMKDDSDNFRESAIIDIMHKLAKNQNINIIIYEPLHTGNEFEGYIILNNFNDFAKKSDLIIANRTTTDLEGIKEKVYSRDLFHNN